MTFGVQCMKNSKYIKELETYLSVKESLTVAQVKKAMKFVFQRIIYYALLNVRVKLTGFVTFFVSERCVKRTTHPVTKKEYVIPKRLILQGQFNSSFKKVLKTSA